MREPLASTSAARRAAAVALGLTAALTLAACAGGGASSTNSGSASAAPAENQGGGKDGVKIIVVGGKSDDPFWSTVKRGVDDAGKVVAAQGGSVQFIGPQNYDNLGPDAAKLIQSALSQDADAVIGADWVPEAQDAAFEQVTAAGVPLFIYNSGGKEAADKVGALGYIGSDEYLAGKAGGEFFGESGAKNVLCVNTLPGAANSEARCKGITDGIAGKGGRANQLPLPSSNFGNPTAVTQGIKAALLKDTSIDGVVTIGTTDANSAFGALEQADLVGKVKLGTFDMDSTQLDRVKAGTQLFCIDQQPYMQGYLAVSLANAYVKYGLRLPQNPILTGPAVIQKNNVEAAIAGAAEGAR